MFQWFRRKDDDKMLTGITEQDLSTTRKLDMVERAKQILDNLKIERRYHRVDIAFSERRRA